MPALNITKPEMTLMLALLEEIVIQARTKA